MRDLTADEREIVAGGWAFDEYRGEDGGGGGEYWAGEVVITARRGGWWPSNWWSNLRRRTPTPPPPSDDSGGGGSDSSDPYSEDGAPGGGAVDPMRAELDKKTKETAEKLQEVEVNVSRCGIPESELFLWSLDGHSANVWKTCFASMSHENKTNLSAVLDLIIKGFEPDNKSTLIYKLLIKADLDMVKEISKAIKNDRGDWFGNNVATLSKGGPQSQMFVALIEGVFKFTTERDDRDN
jgi:hypothetical protein